MALTRVVLPFVLVLLLAACVGPAQFTSALSDPGVTVYDPRLLGAWYGVHKGKYLVITIRAHNNGQVRITFPATTGLTTAESSLTLTGHASELDGKMFYNLKPDPASYFRAFPEVKELPYFLVFDVEFVNDDTIFVKTIMEKNATRLPKAREMSDGYVLVEQSRDELLTTIREISPEKLLNVRVGPFFRLPEPPEEFSALYPP